MAGKVSWEMSGKEVETESFRRIDAEAPEHDFSDREWHIARRLIHTTGDFSIIEELKFRHDPIGAGLKALRCGATIFCDSNMARSGVSVARLQRLYPAYAKSSIHCYIADPEVADMANRRGCTRALAAVEKAQPILDGAIVLIGNAPLALANIVRLSQNENIKPALIIGVPVGFVNVTEAKEMLGETDIPHIVIEKRRGGSALAVATLHGIIENA